MAKAGRDTDDGAPGEGTDDPLTREKRRAYRELQEAVLAYFGELQNRIVETVKTEVVKDAV